MKGITLYHATDLPVINYEDRGDYYTTHQAVRRLGVTLSTWRTYQKYIHPDGQLFTGTRLFKKVKIDAIGDFYSRGRWKCQSQQPQ